MGLLGADGGCGQAGEASALGLLVSAAGQDPLAQEPESPGSRDERLEVRAQRREERVGCGRGVAGFGGWSCISDPFQPKGTHAKTSFSVCAISDSSGSHSLWIPFALLSSSPSPTPALAISLTPTGCWLPIVPVFP